MSDSPFDPPGGPIGGGPVFDPIPGGPSAGCTHAHGDLQLENRRLWGLNRCQNSLWGLAVRPIDHFDGAHPTYARLSYMEPRSESPIRAKLRTNMNAYDEACSFHYGHLHVGRGGYMRAQFCSDHIGDDNTVRSTTMKMLVKKEGTPGRQPTSYMEWAGAYESPMWTEVHYQGPRRRCGENA